MDERKVKEGAGREMEAGNVDTLCLAGQNIRESFYTSHFSPDALVNVMSNCDSYLNSCSENFLVRWDSMGMPKEIEKLNNLPALFTVTEFHPTVFIPSASD